MKTPHVGGVGRPLHPVEPKAKPGFAGTLEEALEAAGVAEHGKPVKPGAPQTLDDESGGQPHPPTTPSPPSPSPPDVGGG